MSQLDLNFREALAAQARASSAYLSYAALLGLGGLLVLIEFGLALFALRQARIAPSPAAMIAAAVILIGGWLVSMAWQRLFLFRRIATMLCLFSGTSPGEAKALTIKMFPNYSAWVGWKRRLRRALIDLGRQMEYVPGIGKRLAGMVFSPCVFALVFAFGNEPDSVAKALSIYWRHGQRSPSLPWRWLKFSALGLAFLFVCLALPSWFFFSSAGAPQFIGIALAAVIAMFMHQAFFAPLALAGVSAALLAESNDRSLDHDLCEKINSLIPAGEFSDKRAD